MIKTSGAEFKRFYNDDKTWPEDSWHEGEWIVVNGEEWDFMKEIDEIPDVAVVKLSGGVVRDLPDGTEPSLEAYFKRWKKRQTSMTIVVECDVSKLKDVKAAIKAAGGKVL